MGLVAAKDVRTLAAMKRWEDLEPDPRLVAILDATDSQRGSRSSLITRGDAPEKNNWSNTFADRCARMVADSIRSSRAAARLTVLPGEDGSAEPPTITYWERGTEKRKKIDVLAGDLIGGLQIAVSLKGVGFRDQASLSFGHNITGRLYELENETRRLHEYRPQAVVVGLYFVPIGAVSDKKSMRSASSFADIVTHLRRMTRRTDVHRQDEWHRVDLGFVGLYVPGDRERFTVRGTGPWKGRKFDYVDGFERGVVRYFDVWTDPPERGRPSTSDTMTLEQVVDAIALARAGPAPQSINWSAPESDA